MYNLTFDNPYNREIVRKLKSFRNKQQGRYIPTNIDPEHFTHQYDPITITGGGFSGGASSYHTLNKLRPHYPADLFEQPYTLNRNQMVGNRLKGGDSDFYNEPFYSSGTSYDRKDNLINDLGAIHSKRREKTMVKTGGKKKVESDSDSESDNEKSKSKPTLKKNVLDKLKKMKGGKKPKKEKAESTSKLLKIFN